MSDDLEHQLLFPTFVSSWAGGLPGSHCVVCHPADKHGGLTVHQDLCGRQGAGDSSPVCTVLTAVDTSICGGLCRGEMKIQELI